MKKQVQGLKRSLSLVFTKKPDLNSWPGKKYGGKIVEDFRHVTFCTFRTLYEVVNKVLDNTEFCRKK